MGKKEDGLDQNGEAFIRIVRKSSTVPIIFPSARTEGGDKVLAQDPGANDYIPKPFGIGELLAHVRASARIAGHRAQNTASCGQFVLDDLSIDYDSRQVTTDGACVHLTQTEYNIPASLSQHGGKSLTYSTIIRAIWGTVDNGSVKKLQVNMANIRKRKRYSPRGNVSSQKQT